MSAEMDEALDMLTRYGPEYQGGLANHAPMVADALVAMGRSDAVLPWVSDYSRSLEEKSVGRQQILASSWKEALGDFGRHADWVTFFQEQLKENSWESVLARWVEQLAPGLAAAAAHGLLRTAHSVRSLEENVNDLRLKELAEGLGYWASRYQTLPISDEAPAFKGPPHSVISEVPLLDRSGRGGAFITDRLEKLYGFEPFASTIHLLEDSGNVVATLSDLTRVFVRIYLMNPRKSLIAFVHAVTGPSSLRILLPYLSEGTKRRALLYAWQLAAAIYSTNAEILYSSEMETQEIEQEDVIDRAVESGDEHAIKFTEVCLREHKANPDPIFITAALHASHQLRR